MSETSPETKSQPSAGEVRCEWWSVEWTERGMQRWEVAFDERLESALRLFDALSAHPQILTVRLFLNDNKGMRDMQKIHENTGDSPASPPPQQSEVQIGPNPCPHCGGEYGEHRSPCVPFDKRDKAHGRDLSPEEAERVRKRLGIGNPPLPGDVEGAAKAIAMELVPNQSIVTRDYWNEPYRRKIEEIILRHISSLQQQIAAKDGEIRDERVRHSQSLDKAWREHDAEVKSLRDKLNAEKEDASFYFGWLHQATGHEPTVRPGVTFVEQAIDANEAIWQHRLDKIISAVFPDRDGSGSDGDALELTATELQQAFNHQQEKIDAVAAHVEGMRSALEFYADKNHWERRNENPDVCSATEEDEGAIARSALATEQEGEGWIPVGERLPENLVDVLVIEDGGIRQGYYRESSDNWVTFWNDSQPHLVSRNGITCWRYHPLIPAGINRGTRAADLPEISPENHWREVWHRGCSGSGIMRRMNEFRSSTIEPGTLLGAFECLGCGVRCFAGVGKSRQIIVEAALPSPPSPPAAAEQDECICDTVLPILGSRQCPVHTHQARNPSEGGEGGR